MNLARFLTPADRLSVGFALDSLRTHRSRSTLAVAGIVIGIVTVVLIASILENARRQVAALFEGLGTNNIVAFHLSQDPYSPPADREANRRPLEVRFGPAIARLSDHVDRVGVQLIVPPIVNGRALVASAGGSESDTALAEGTTAMTMDVIGATLQEGRAFTPIEEEAGARVAILGSSVKDALFAGRSPLGREIRLGGVAFTVVGVMDQRPGGAFGENRQDSVVSIPVRAAQSVFPDARNVLLYIEALGGRRESARADAETILRSLRGLSPAQDSDFNLTSPDQIIAVFNQLGSAIGAATLALAGISLFIGAIGIANVMVISVTERTREIGIRRALGATKASVRRQFLIEASMLSGLGGVLGAMLALVIGFLVTLALPRYNAQPPWNAVAAGVFVSVTVGLIAGYAPAARASAVDPIEALRHD
jgi:putative ABC transport system permease protein